MTATLSKIQGAGRDGDFVFTLQGQTGVGTATDKGFGHVHKDWYAKTISFEQGLEQLEAGKAATQDFVVPLGTMTPDTDRFGRFVMRDVLNRNFIPTPHALNQMGTLFGTGTWFPQQLAASDRMDAGLMLAKVMKWGRDGLDLSKPRLFRTRNDGTLRAVLSSGPKGYAIVDNRWFLEVIKGIVPGGRLSHWRGDSDEIYGNVLIPDTILEEEDSDYGGMVSLGNSEIGTRSIENNPSVFRAICMNGCIWSQTFGKKMRKVHKGRIDLNDLRDRIRKNIEEQIPLLPQGIQRMLGLRVLGTDVNIKPVIAQLAEDYGMGKGQATAVIKGYIDEVKVVPQYRNTLFAVLNGVTRAGQQMDNASWLKFDLIGGDLSGYDRNKWENLTGRAKRLTAEQVDDAFALAV